MGRHRTSEEKAELCDKAVAMRVAGIGGKRIATELGIGGSLACELLRGVPLPGSLARPRAKDDLREVAVLLRQQGRTYNEIRDELKVSKGSLSLWLRNLDFPTEEQRDVVRSAPDVERGRRFRETDQDVARALRQDGWLLREIAVAMGIAPKVAFAWTRGVPVPARAVHGRTPEETRAMGRAYWDAKLAERELEREEIKARGAATVGTLSDRELELVAVTAYWCEGSKSKPWARREFLQFINSDGDLVLVFLAYLHHRGFALADMRLSVSIHESADIPAAERWWADLIGAAVASFAKPSVKRHNPKTVRRNIGHDYVGCLSIGVRGSRVLYQHMEGVWRGIAAAVDLREGSTTRPVSDVA